MNAGKTTSLLQSSYNYQERGMDTLLFSPSIDHRFAVGTITSRIGLSANAIAFNEKDNLFTQTQQAIDNNPNIQCVLVDEAQFLTKEQVSQLTDIADQLHIPVLAYGLRTDFRGEPFPGSMALLAWAEELSEIKTICHCGKKATMNMRIDAQGNPVTKGEQIEIGGNDRYVSTCRRHFKLGHSHRQHEKPKA
jgi:thymidine kinase